MLRGALQAVLDEGSDAAARLHYADTRVAFRVEHRPEEGVTLLLDREPCALASNGDAAEVEIVLSADQAAAFAVGALPMPAAVAGGLVGATGPVRKYLEVDPILRSSLARHAGRHAEARPTFATGGLGPIDPDLLAIETRDLHKSFGANHILQGLNLTIPEGSISVILGPSGTGKSVCLNHIIGLMRPDRGDVFIRGQSLNAMGRAEVLRLRTDMGVMFQDGALFSNMNVYDNVAFPLRQHTDYNEREVDTLVRDRLGSVGLSDAGGRMPNELSGGMRKRAGLARALALDPAIVLCDEPDSGLDPVRTALLGDLLVERHSEQGGTMVVVTHNVMLARMVADHMTVIWRGQVLESGMADDILNSRTEFVQQFLAGEARGPLGMDA